MLNVYRFYTNPEELEQREYATALFEYNFLDDYVGKLSEMFDSGNVPDEYYYIERVFGNPKRYHTWVASSGNECILSPLGVDKRPSYSIKLIIEDDTIYGYYTHYTKQTQFYEERSKLDLDTQMNEILTLGLTELAKAELDD